MHRIGMSALVLAIGLAAAPSAQAQSSRVFVCRDGQTRTASNASHVCDRHGGLDGRATARLRQSGAYGGYGVNGTASRGVYNGNGGANGGRGVYNGGVYNGGVYNGGNGQVQCADGLWSTVGAVGCNGHGGVYTGNSNGTNDGRWTNRGRQTNGTWNNRHDDDDDDRNGDGRGRGHGHEKKEHKDHDRDREHGRDHDRDHDGDRH